jgi:hypothetical protein
MLAFVMQRLAKGIYTDFHPICQRKAAGELERRSVVMPA